MGGPTLSLVVSTLGRSVELITLFQSLERQDAKSFEVIVVDQNDDDRIVPIVDMFSKTLTIRHLRKDGLLGLNRGRNQGWKAALGRYVLFPDDDCWYPPTFLSHGMALAEKSDADFVTGRAADAGGRDVNGRYASAAHDITRQNAWVSGIEWVLFVRRACITQLGGFDENIGAGAASPWQAGDLQELLLRGLKCGLRGVYDPTLIGHHAELDIITPDDKMIVKGRGYARGMGYVLRKSGFSVLSAGYWAFRSVANLAIALVRGKPDQARYYLNLAIGRMEGYFMTTIRL